MGPGDLSSLLKSGGRPSCTVDIKRFTALLERPREVILLVLHATKHHQCVLCTIILHAFLRVHLSAFLKVICVQLGLLQENPSQQIPSPFLGSQQHQSSAGCSHPFSCCCSAKIGNPFSSHPQNQEMESPKGTLPTADVQRSFPPGIRLAMENGEQWTLDVLKAGSVCTSPLSSN